MTKVIIISGYGGHGGSTVAHINLCNLFNDKGLDATFVSPGNWSNKCKFINITTFLNNLTPHCSASIIYHFLNPAMFAKVPGSLGSFFSKITLTCHETNIYPLKKYFPNGFGTLDNIHMVSESQKKWHGIEDDRIKIIPNVISKVNKVGNPESGIAGVVGSIDRHKRTGLAISNAARDGYKTIKVIGHVSDPEYKDEIKKNLPRNTTVRFLDHVDGLDNVYNNLEVVYHASTRETFNFVKPECEQAGVKYIGLDSAESGADYWKLDDIFKAWKEIL